MADTFKQCCLLQVTAIEANMGAVGEHFIKHSTLLNIYIKKNIYHKCSSLFIFTK